jgi:hypothetical protein
MLPLRRAGHAQRCQILLQSTQCHPPQWPNDVQPKNRVRAAYGIVAFPAALVPHQFNISSRARIVLGIKHAQSQPGLEGCAAH